MPFCPSCREEFQEWAKVCSDCGVPLVKELRPEREKPAYRPDEQLVTVAVYFYPAEAHVAAAALKAAGIRAVVVDEFGAMANAMFGVQVRVQVKKGDTDKAIKILKSIEKG